MDPPLPPGSGRPGTSLQAAYPQQSVQRPGCGFPILRLVALFSLATGMITGWVTGTWVQPELLLFQQLWDHLRPGQLLLGDRGFCTWGLLAQCQARGIHAVFRLRGVRRRDFRRGKSLGPNQRLVRWQMELAFRNLKITLQMDQLSGKNPENLDREIRLHLLVHNLTRRVMLEAARRHRVPVDRLSFAGALATCRCCGEALLQTRSLRKRRELLAGLFEDIAQDLVPDRPGRREPRALKRRPKPYPRLTRHRHRFREIQHQNRYYIPKNKRP